MASDWEDMGWPFRALCDGTAFNGMDDTAYDAMYGDNDDLELTGRCRTCRFICTAGLAEGYYLALEMRKDKSRCIPKCTCDPTKLDDELDDDEVDYYDINAIEYIEFFHGCHDWEINWLKVKKEISRRHREATPGCKARLVYK